MLRGPTTDGLRKIAAGYGLHLSDEDLEAFRRLITGSLESYRRVDQLVEPALPVNYPRRPGNRPRPEDNPYNAWYWKCSIKGAPEGPLSGKRVAIKDNVCVAGVPMMNGASILEGYVPEMDATIVTRILDDGGEIVGKSTCEHLCFSGSSFTSDTGLVPNPHDPTRSVGGSSTGSAVLVALGECDMAIGGDQGGSIGHPSAWTGVYGLKPTYGLVPYTGIFPIEQTLDHIGPMAATVGDVALLLESLAGPDGLDPRQYAPKTANYTEFLDRGVKGLKIGVVKEGFGHANSEPDVDAKVKASAELLKKLGAVVEDISVPMHLSGTAIWLPIAAEGATELMMKGNGMGTNWRGLYTTSLLDAHAGWRHRADELSDSLKITMLLGHYFTKHHRGHYYSKAQNLSRKLRAAYDAGSARRTGALVPYSNNNQVVLPPGNGRRQHHRRIVAPYARIEVETTRNGRKKTTYHLDHGYAEEMWWEDD